jgi:nicotinamidase-related amidase
MATALKGPLGASAINLCIDMQRLFVAGGPWAAPWLERRRPVIAALASHHAQLTVFTRFIPPRRAADAPGMWRRFYERWPEITLSQLDPALLDLVPELAALAPPAAVFDKPVYSPFAGTSLPQFLRERAVDTIIVSGAETDVCVLASVLGAIDHGYRVVVAVDAICSSSDEGHDALLKLLANRFTEQVETATVDAILTAWRA